MPRIQDPTPAWLKPENASVLDSPVTKALRILAGLIGADDPQSQVLGLMAPLEVPAYKGTAAYIAESLPTRNGLGRIIEGANRVPQEKAELAGFFAQDPAIASRFADLHRNGAVYPMTLKFDNPVVIDAGGVRASAFQFDDHAAKHGTQSQLATFRRAMSDPSVDGVVIKNTGDEGTIYVTKRPNQARFRFSEQRAGE